MPRQIIIKMQDEYPFGQYEEATNQYTRIIVRKKIAVSQQSRTQVIRKANYMRKLNSQTMIKLQSILEQDDNVHFMFQYVPIKVETWISNINQQFIETFRDQLAKFANYLAKNDIIITFKLTNIGMDQNCKAKYFLNLDYQIDPTINREKLKSAYIRQIYELFKPYIRGNSTSLSSIEAVLQESQAKQHHQNQRKIYQERQQQRQRQAQIYKKKEQQKQLLLQTSQRKEMEKTQIGDKSGYKSTHIADGNHIEFDDGYFRQFMDVLDDSQVSKTFLHVNIPSPNLYQKYQSNQMIPQKPELDIYQILGIQKRQFFKGNPQHLRKRVTLAIQNSIKVIDKFKNWKRI